MEKDPIKKLLEGVREIKFHRLLTIAVDLARRVGPIDKQIYVQVFLNDGENFCTHNWTSWEDTTTGEKIVLFICEDKSILVPSRSINRIELLYEQPSDGAIGFQGPLEELRVVVSNNVKVEEKVIAKKGINKEDHRGRGEMKNPRSDH